MFGKLLSRFNKPQSTHPLGSEQNLDALLADIPQGDPARQLLDVDAWLADMDGHTLEIGPLAAMQAVTKLDQFSRAAADLLLFRYLKSGQREYLSDAFWSTLDDHAQHLFHCYHAILRVLGPQIQSDVERLRLARCAARALRAWALRKLLLRCRYRQPTPDFWREGHELLKLIAPWSLLPLKVVAYRDEPDTTPLDEYLGGVYLELAPLGNLVPPQLLVVTGFLRHCETLEFYAAQRTHSSHVIDSNGARGPRRLDAGVDLPFGDSVRYLSTVSLRPALMKLALQVKRQQDIPAWIDALPLERDAVEAALLTLVIHWGPAPPQRKTDRVSQDVALKAVFGFDLVRRMIACSHFARMGRSLRYDVVDLDRLFAENRFGKLTTAELSAAAQAAEASSEPEIVNPLDTLRTLESAGAAAQMEAWVQVDASATGLGVTLPGILSRHRIGALVGVRYDDGLEWRLGLIRRIGRDAANRPSIGVETLGWTFFCAQAKPVGSGGAWSAVADAGHDWIDAIIIGSDNNRLALPAGSFVADLEVDVRGEDISWRIRLLSLIERGTDYDLIEIQRLT